MTVGILGYALSLPQFFKASPRWTDSLFWLATIGALLYPVWLVTHLPKTVLPLVLILASLVLAIIALI